LTITKRLSSRRALAKTRQNRSSVCRKKQRAQKTGQRRGHYWGHFGSSVILELFLSLAKITLGFYARVLSRIYSNNKILFGQVARAPRPRPYFIVLLALTAAVIKLVCTPAAVTFQPCLLMMCFPAFLPLLSGARVILVQVSFCYCL
jgi:hypothetical protein